MDFVNFLFGVLFIPATILGAKYATGTTTGKCFVATAVSVGARWGDVFDAIFGLNPFTELFNFELNLVNSLICGWLGSGTSYLMNMVFTDKGVNFFHNHTDAAQQQSCPDCGPYRRMGLEEIAGAYEHDGGKGNEQ